VSVKVVQLARLRVADDAAVIVIFDDDCRKKKKSSPNFKSMIFHIFHAMLLLMVISKIFYCYYHSRSKSLSVKSCIGRVPQSPRMHIT
jgi:hypothetical protein